MNIDLRQWSPQFFIAVMELISRKTSMQDISRKPVYYGNDLAVVADGEADL